MVTRSGSSTGGSSQESTTTKCSINYYMTNIGFGGFPNGGAMDFASNVAKLVSRISLWSQPFRRTARLMCR